jgi:hypothetical protein
MIYNDTVFSKISLFYVDSPSRDFFHPTNSQAAEVLGLFRKYEYVPSARKIRISTTNIGGINITSYKGRYVCEANKYNRDADNAMLLFPTLQGGRHTGPNFPP